MGPWVVTNGSKATYLIHTGSSEVRRLPALKSPALMWSHDGQVVYGVTSQDGRAVLHGIDVARGQVHRVAEYPMPLDLEDDINGTLKFNRTPDGSGFVTTTVVRRSDI